MRHRQRLSYAASTVLGLTAPVLAAVLLTSSVPSTAEPVPPAPTMAADVDDPIPHAAAPAPAPSPTATVVAARAAAVAAPRTIASHRTVTVRATHRAVVRQTTRTTTTTTAKTSTSSGWTTTAQPWGTDDYPYRTQSDFYAMDKWGFTERQCVSFAAWRLAQHGHAINNKDSWGSAYSWDDTARRLGDRVTSTPRIGAIAQWNAHESGPYYGKGASRPNGTFTAGGYGHVGWVKAVYADGSALVEQYNLGGDRSYSVMRVKAPRYLLIG